MNNTRDFTGSGTVELINASSIRPQSVQWLWQYWLASGKLHILAGAPGTGKTTIALDIAASFANGGINGRTWPDGSYVPAGNVVLWTGEDSVEDTIIPRLLAGGNQIGSIYVVGDTYRHGRRRPFDPSADIPLLKNALETIGNVRLLIIDPIVSVVAGDSHKNSDVRKGLAPLVEIAEEYGCAVLGISHVTKSSKGRSPLDRVVGSLGFGAVARIVMLTAKVEPDDDDDGAPRGVLVLAKSNIGKDVGGFSYTIETGYTETDWGPVASSRVVWDKTPLKGTARSILAAAEGDCDGNDSSRLGEAVNFLTTALAGGPLPYPEIEAKALEIGISKATLKRAKQRIGIRHQKQTGVGSASPFIWSLPLPLNLPTSSAGFHAPPYYPTSVFDTATAYGSFRPIEPYGTLSNVHSATESASIVHGESHASVDPIASVDSISDFPRPSSNEINPVILDFCVQDCKARWHQELVKPENSWLRDLPNADVNDVLDVVDDIARKAVDQAFDDEEDVVPFHVKVNYQAALGKLGWWHCMN